VRLVARSAGRLLLHDVARDGRALVSHEVARLRMMARRPGDAEERELSWSDVSVAADLSADGGTLLFAEVGEPEGNRYAAYLRATDGAPAIRLGEGLPLALSPDRRWALALLHGDAAEGGGAAPPGLVLLPTGAGDPRAVAQDGSATCVWARLLPGGERLVFSGHDAGGRAGLWVQDALDAPARAVPLDREIAFGAVDPEGRRVAGVDRDGGLIVVELANGDARRVPGDFAGQSVVQWSSDGEALYMRGAGAPMEVARVEIATGKAQPWRSIMPLERVGLLGFAAFAMTSEGRGYAYSYAQILSRLFEVDGLR
jgi:hypothetical protein